MVKFLLVASATPALDSYFENKKCPKYLLEQSRNELAIVIDKILEKDILSRKEVDNIQKKLDRLIFIKSKEYLDNFLFRVLEETKKFELTFEEFFQNLVFKKISLIINRIDRNWQDFETYTFFGLEEILPSRKGQLIVLDKTGFKLILEDIENNKSKKEYKKILRQLPMLYYLLSSKKGNKFRKNELAELDKKILFLKKIGHVFIPTEKEWSLAGSIAQWFGSVTFMYLPGEKVISSGFHGGIQGFEIAKHDIEHVTDERYLKIFQYINSENLGLEGLFSSSAVEVEKLKKTFRNIEIMLVLGMEDTIKKIRKKYTKTEEKEIFEAILFFTIHEGTILLRFLQTMRMPSEDKMTKFLQFFQKKIKRNSEYYPFLNILQERDREIAEFFSILGSNVFKK